MRLTSTLLSLAAAGVLLGGVGVANAATIAVDPTTATAVIGTGNPTTPATLLVRYSAAGTLADAEADGLEIELAFPAADLTLVTATAATGFNCDISPGLLLITYNNTGTQIADGTLCTLTFNTAATSTLGVKALTFQNPVVLSGITPVVPNLTNGSIEITNAPVVTGPSIVAGTPAFGSTTPVAGGFLGGAVVTQTISFGASTGGANGGTTDLVCSETDAGTALSASATQNDIADGVTPASITASFTPGAARTVVVNCTATRDGAGAQAFSYTFDVAAGVAPPPPPPPPEVIPASSLWSQLSLIALFAALGGLVMVLRRNG